MAAGVRWNSGAGTQTLTTASSYGRLNGWKVDPHDVGEEAIGVGDGMGYKYALRTDYTVAFRLGNIANSDEAKVQDFLKWVNSYGPFAIDTDDSESNSYESCQIAPGTKAEVSPPDPATLDFELSVTAVNLAVSPSPFRCVY